MWNIIKKYFNLLRWSQHTEYMWLFVNFAQEMLVGPEAVFLVALSFISKKIKLKHVSSYDINTLPIK